MKKIFVLVSLLLTLLFTPITAYAKPRLDVVKNGGWVDLSDEDMQDTIKAIVEQVAKEEQLPYVPMISCFDWPECNILAYNTLITKTICVNLSYFRNDIDASLVGESVEYHLVKTLAHEVRHSYQYEHQFDDSDYGRAVAYNYTYPVVYNGYNLVEYEAQFKEADASAYGIDFANRFFKKSRK